MEKESKMLHLNCRTCLESFVAIDMGSINDVDDLFETGICPRCLLKCIECGIRPFSTANSDNQCDQCYKYLVDNASPEDDDAVTDLVLELMLEELLGEIITNIECEIITNIECEIITNIEDEIIQPIDDDIVTNMAVFMVDSIVPNFDYILIERPVDVIDLTYEDDFNMNKKSNYKIKRAYRRSCGNLGSDGSGGSTNGDLSASACEAIVNALQLNSSDIICDFGSGGGKALALCVSMGKCRGGIGIEIEAMRHNIAMNFIKYLITKEPSIDVPISLIHDDLHNFENALGPNKVFMYDAVFEPGLLNHITAILNATRSIQYVVSTQSDLVTYGFEGKMLKNLGSLTASGGAMHHTFYLYSSNLYDAECVEWNPKLLAAFNIATNRNERAVAAVDHMNAFHLSERSPRRAAIQKILGEDKLIAKSYESLCEHFSTVKVNVPIVVNNKSYLCTNKGTRYYLRFNEKLLLNKQIEVEAVVHLKNKMALVAPCYDGQENGLGKLLVAIVYDPLHKTGTYFGYIYNWDVKKVLKDELLPMFTHFDHNSSMPCDMSDILKKFRNEYPLAPVTPELADMPRSLSVSSTEPYSPPADLRKRSRQQVADDIKANKQRQQLADAEEMAVKQLKTDNYELQRKLKDQEEAMKTTALLLKKVQDEKKKVQDEKKKVQDEKKKVEDEKKKVEDEKTKLKAEFEQNKRQRTKEIVASVDVPVMTKEVADLEKKLAVSENTNVLITKWYEKSEQRHIEEAKEQKEERRYQDNEKNKMNKQWMKFMKKMK